MNKMNPAAFTALTPHQLVTASSSIGAAIATAVRDYLGDDFKERHGFAFLLIGTRSVLIENGATPKPMTPSRFEDLIKDRYDVKDTTAQSDRSKLEEAGLITVVPNPDDGRSSILTLTEEGRAIYEGFAMTIASINLVFSKMLASYGPLPDDDAEKWAKPYMRDFAKVMRSPRLDADPD